MHLLKLAYTIHPVTGICFPDTTRYRFERLDTLLSVEVRVMVPSSRPLYPQNHRDRVIWICLGRSR